MNIKDSKFFKAKPILFADENENYRLSIEDTDFANSYAPYHMMLSSFFGVIHLPRDIAIHQEQLSHMQKCTDFTTLSYSKKNHLYESELCYFHPEHEVFIIATPNIAFDYNEETFEEGILRVDKIFYDRANSNAKQQVQQFFDTCLHKHITKEAKVSILIKDTNGFELHTNPIKPYHINLDTMYNDDFLPVHRHIKEQLSGKNNKGIALLHGLSGTGKTNYIKWLTSQLPEKQFIFVPTSVIHLLSDPAFIPLLIDNKNAVLVLEDCENYISERHSNNPQTDVVASVLNLADGMLSDIVECQMICTFNAPIHKIDAALLRQGRLIAEYHFDKLTVNKANEYLSAIGEAQTAKEPMTLAELTNLGNDHFHSVEESKPSFGFT